MNTSKQPPERENTSRCIKTLNLQFQPRSRFRVRTATGYSTYSAILSILESADPSLSKQIHDTNFSLIHNTGLAGNFDNIRESEWKYVDPNETYYLDVSFLTGRVQDAYETLANEFIMSDTDLNLTNGSLELVKAETDSVGYRELYNSCKGLDDVSQMWFTFHTPTCLQDGDSITTMVPHRLVLFRSLLNSWQTTSDYIISLTSDEIRDNLIEKPGGYNLTSHSVSTSGYNSGSGRTNHIRQGFQGYFGYQFKKPPKDVKTKILALSKYAELAGAGFSTARGCGSITVTIK